MHDPQQRLWRSPPRGMVNSKKAENPALTGESCAICLALLPSVAVPLIFSEDHQALVHLDCWAGLLLCR